jgi:hypothetical protein|tara:strand:+ start:283 stop:720 length:438 start_codon:yes stop_codon:yes gene_type:complete
MKTVLIAAATLALTGCASIVSESTYPVSIQSSPAGATYEVTNQAGMIVSSGVTPGQVTLQAGAGYFDGELYRVSYKRDGYSDQVATLDTNVDGWYWGNFIFGGLLGMLIVDPATGAMYKLPNSVHGNLIQVPTPLASAVKAEETP